MSQVPAYVEATYTDCNTVDVKGSPEYDPEKVAAAKEAYTKAFRRLEEAASAILDRPVSEPAHITDLALICTVWDDGEGDANEDLAARALMLAVLSLGGLSSRDCNIHLMYEAYRQRIADALNQPVE